MPVYKDDPKATARGKATAENMTLAPKGKRSSRKLWIVLFNHEKDGHVLPSSLTFDSEAEARRAQKNRRGARLQSRTIVVASIVAALVSAELAMCSPARSQVAPCPNGCDVASRGLGDGGTASLGRTLSRNAPMNTGARISMVTGPNPSSAGGVMIPVGQLYQQGVHPIASCMVARTGADYAGGFPAPDWPDMVTVFQDDYDLVKMLLCVDWRASAPLQPNSAYTLTCTFAIRDPAA